MLKILIRNLKFKNKFDFGEKSFFCGVFFLSSALPLSVIFFLVSISISLSINKLLFFKDKYNQILFICTGLMIFSCINSTLNLSEITNKSVSDIFLGLGNWIPLFILFFSSQIYLKTSEKRKIFSKVIISGTIPVIISCILQSVLNIYGPFEVLNGLIVWFQKPINNNEGVSGLFNNQNYAGLWLSSVLVFSIYEIKSAKRRIKNKFTAIFITTLITYFLILTNSRNALIGMLISIFSFVRRKYLLIIPISIGTLLALKSLVFYYLNDYYFIFKNILNNSLFIKLFTFDFANFLNYPRVEIYSLASRLILKSPLLGWGPSTFPILYEKGWIINNPGVTEYPIHQHAHNIVFELAYNFGIPLAIIMSFFIIKILKNSFLVIYKNFQKNSDFLIDKTWFISVIIILVSHINDVTYYDGKISILIWTLLAGLKCIIEQKKSKVME
ncbi:O-antigen ligase family protein [Prochlorococcus sp. AH-716-E13]|nr:O-antigen ligase family protein [Prochlorococcus sp. AH-716-E13]